jgi:squalene-hopene/tetraprenyl-beta-curcumene cyclase
MPGGTVDPVAQSSALLTKDFRPGRLSGLGADGRHVARPAQGPTGPRRGSLAASMGFPVLCLSAVALVAGSLGLWSQEAPLRPGVVDLPESLRREAALAQRRGVAYLLGKQGADGSWQGFPAITALVCVALKPCALPEGDEARIAAVEKGRRYLLSSVQADGAICTPDRIYVNYSTAICLGALAVLGNPDDAAAMRLARHYLVSQQLDEDFAPQPVNKDDLSYGGFGYGEASGRGPGMGGPGMGGPGGGPGRGPGGEGGRGGEGGDAQRLPPPMRPPRADLSCTQWVLEALYLSDALDRDSAGKHDAAAREVDLAWEKAITFLQAVQNLQKTGQGTWAVTSTRDGGFAYLPIGPGESDSARSYGSMTYAGLKSMIYAKLDRDDPRVKAAVEWARLHYTVGENPGMGASGLFYYLQTFAKAHAAWGAATITTADGVQHDWRRDLVTELLQLQKDEGQWYNDESGRWQESNPELVTAYALISLAMATGSTP